MNIFSITMTPISPPYDDGPKNIVVALAKRLTKDRFYFISSSKKGFPESGNVTFISSPFQAPGRHSMTLLQKVFIFFTTILNMKKIDIFQFFFTPRPYFSNVYRGLLKRNNKKSIQVVSSIHTLFDKNPKEPVSSLFFADYVVVHSEYAKRTLFNRGMKNVVRIYPGIEFDRFDVNDARINSGEYGEINGEHFNIIYPGTYKILEESYTIEKFCEIAALVISKNNKARFIMACRVRTGEDLLLEKKFKAAIEEHGIKRAFILLRTVDDMPALFNRCAVGIMPALRPMKGILEIPLVLLELSAMEKPVIYGNVPPLDEIEKLGIGMQMKDGEPASYAAALIRLSEDEKAGFEMGRRSKEAVRNFFNMDKAANEYQKLYENLESRING